MLGEAPAPVAQSPNDQKADMTLLRSLFRFVQFDRPSITSEEGSF
jgi:hypothetical protein